MIRPILLASFLVALAGCENTSVGDDIAVAQAIGAVQPALEAQSALLVTLDSCEDCDDLQELGSYLGSALGSCSRVEALSRLESICPQVADKAVVQVGLEGCDLGLGRLVSGTLWVNQGAGSAVRYFETDLISGDHGLVGCGTVSGAGGGHSVSFEALAHGAAGGDVALSWSGPAGRDDDGLHVRSGSMYAEFTGGDGIGYRLEAEASRLERAHGESLPSAGRITFQGKAGTAMIEFGPDTPRTGGLHLTASDGVQQTVVVNR